jgi:hypothetical protein
MSDEMYKSTIPFWIITIVGFITILEYFFPPLNTLVGSTFETIRNYATILAGGGYGIGI